MLTFPTMHQDRRALSPMELYLGDIQATPLLNAEEERDLAYRIREGDPEARNQMVRANLRLVVSIAHRYAHGNMNLADLVAEGNLGLLRAVECFDPTRNVRFGTYATYWIKQSIRRAVMNTSRLVRLPVYVQVLVSEWKKTTTRLHEELGRLPVEDEVVHRMRLTPKKLASVKKAMRSHQAGAHYAWQPVEEMTDDTIVDRKSPSPSDLLAEREEMHRVLCQVEQLSPREALVLRLRYGLTGEAPQRLAQIGTRLGLTRARVGQIEQAALQKLRAKLQASRSANRGNPADREESFLNN